MQHFTLQLVGSVCVHKLLFNFLQYYVLTNSSLAKFLKICICIVLHDDLHSNTESSIANVIRSNCKN